MLKKLADKFFSSISETPKKGAAVDESKESILSNPFITGKLFPLQGHQAYSVTEKPAHRGKAESTKDLPAPPTPELRMWYGVSEEDYLAGGARDVDSMLRILERAGANPSALYRVLEVGCAAARMLRHYPFTEGKSELWGTDISAKHIAWCQQHLGPSLFFVTHTTSPHLPFEDNYFDLIFCGSVFTHISDMADAWFLELRRVLRSGGYTYITIHDEHIIKWLLGEGALDKSIGHMSEMIKRLDAEASVLTRPYASFSIDADARNQVQVFYDSQSLVEKWARWMTFVSKDPGAYGHQTALLFRKANPAT